MIFRFSLRIMNYCTLVIRVVHISVSPLPFISFLAVYTYILYMLYIQCMSILKMLSLHPLSNTNKTCRLPNHGRRRTGSHHPFISHGILLKYIYCICVCRFSKLFLTISETSWPGLVTGLVSVGESEKVYNHSYTQ